MKKVLLVILLVFVVLSACSNNTPTNEGNTGEFDATQIIAWYNDSEMWRTVKNGSWSHDAGDQITDEELAQIFSMAMKAQSAVQWTPWFFITVRDVEEQNKILGDLWGDGVVAEGTVTVLVLADQVLSEEQGHVSSYEGSYMHVPKYAYFDSGTASALLHLGATSLGYHTHYFGSINGENAPADLADGEYQSLSYYVKDEYERAWGFRAGEYGDVELDEDYVYPVAGNTVFVMAIVIGKPAGDDVDVTSWATNYARPDNWAIWDAEE